MRIFSARRIAVAVVASLSLSTSVSAYTIATFADPAWDGSTPLFTLEGDKLNGGWDGTGLDLVTPVTGDVYTDVTFTMTELTVDQLNRLSGGTIQFLDELDNLVLRIDFNSAQLFAPFGFGASELAADDVNMSGAIITGPLTEESFSFSFANQVALPDGFSWTAAFTSSAIPEPSSLILLGLGLFGVCRRRR